MKNIGAGASEVFTPEQKAVEEGKIEEEEYTEKKNEMYFYLDGNPTYHISAVGKWYENSHGEVIGDVDTYFLHVLTNQRCESVWDCFSGWSEQDEKSAEQWETLCQHIEELDGLEEYICDEKRVEV